MSTLETITARDGASLAIRHWAPVVKARASLLIIPGLGEHGGRYERAAGIFAAAGLDTWALDLRGFGASGGRRAYVESLNVWLRDIADRITVLRAMGRPVVLLGHSMGGLVAAAYAESDDQPQPNLLVLSAPAVAGNIPAWKQALARILGRVAPTLAVKNGFDGSILSRDPAVGIDYLADPLNVHSTTTRLGAILLDAQAPTIAALGRIKIPTLVIHGGADHLVPTASSEVFARQPNMERRVYPGLAHETFNEPEGPEAVGDVAAWIGAHLPAV